MRVAIIDTGTNSTRLLVADVSGDRVEELIRQTRVTRLGEGVDRGGNLGQAARERVIACIDEYASLIAGLEVSNAMILATSSVRDASNGQQFLQSLAESLGAKWKLLSGDEEAVLSFSGASSGFDLKGGVNLFDVGGGSTEVVSGEDGKVVFSRSLRLGCVRLTERFISSDPANSDELEKVGSFIDGLLGEEIDRNRLIRPATTIAVAGTVTALAAIDLGLQRYDATRIHGHIISHIRIQRLLKELSAMNQAQRMQLHVLEPGRADVIVAGTMIIDRLMRHTDAEELIVSELDILDGAAMAMAEGKL